MKKRDQRKRRGKRHRAKARSVEPIDKLALLKRAADKAVAKYEQALAENAAKEINAG